MVSKVTDLIDTAINELRYINHPFIREIAATEIPAECYLAWAIQKYHQVFHSNRAFAAIASNTDVLEARRYEIANLVAEETGYTSGSAAHYDLMMRFCRALGASEEDVWNTPMGDPLKDYLSWVIPFCQTHSWQYGFSVYYALESQTSESVAIMYRRLKGRFGLTEHDLEWFPVHTTDDVEHGRQRGEILNRYQSSDSLEVNQLVTAAVEASKRWWKLHDFYFDILTDK